jgi:hypothetical protein
MRHSLSQKQQILLLVNGYTGIIAIGFTLFGLLLSMGTNWPATILLNFETTTVTGTVTHYELTSRRINHGSHISYYEFTYNHAGQNKNGHSYGYKRFNEMDTVQIEYSNYWPTISRIKGTTRSTTGKKGWPFTIMLILSLPFMIRQLSKGIRKTTIFNKGRQTLVSINAKEPTNAKVLSKIVYQYSFSFVAQNGKTYMNTFKTTHIEQIDDKKVMAYYLPTNPNKFLIINTIPGFDPQKITQ